MSPKALDNIPGLKDALKRHQKQKDLKRPRVNPPTNPAAKAGGKKTAPAAVIEVLSLVGHPLRNQNIISLAKISVGIIVPRTRFSTLRRDGQHRAIANAGVPEGVYPLPALSALTFKPIEGYLALSNWSLEKRLVSPQTEGLLSTRYTLALLDLMEELDDGDTSCESALRKMALDMCGKEIGYQPLRELSGELRNHCEKILAAHQPREEHSINQAIETFQARFGQKMDAPLWQLVGLPDQFHLTVEQGEY